MKKILMFLFVVMMFFTLTACGTKEEETNKKENNNSQEQQNAGKNEEKKEKKKEESNQNNSIVIDDEIIEFDEEDNVPYEEEKVVVKKVINCDGCVYAYFNAEGDKAKRIGSTLSKDEYTTDITNLKTMGGKQRHNFFGLVLSGNKISKAYACVLKDSKIYCIQGSTNGAYFSNNIGILNQIFTTGQCRYISNGHTYTCTDGNYNGDTITTGFTSLHYETSCTIYGSDSNTGKLICH